MYGVGHRLGDILVYTLHTLQVPKFEVSHKKIMGYERLFLLYMHFQIVFSNT